MEDVGWLVVLAGVEVFVLLSFVLLMLLLVTTLEVVSIAVEDVCVVVLVIGSVAAVVDDDNVVKFVAAGAAEFVPSQVSIIILLSLPFSPIGTPLLLKSLLSIAPTSPPPATVTDAAAVVVTAGHAGPIIKPLPL